jgi:hypothetical protein
LFKKSCQGIGVQISRDLHVMRRSTRLELGFHVLLSSLDPSRKYFEEGRTVSVNAHGAGVVVGQSLPKGTPVMLDLMLESRWAKARVVDVVAVPGKEPRWLVGIALLELGNFWKVENPPEDWRIPDQPSSSPSGRLTERPST